MNVTDPQEASGNELGDHKKRTSLASWKMFPLHFLEMKSCTIWILDSTNLRDFSVLNHSACILHPSYQLLVYYLLTNDRVACITKDFTAENADYNLNFVL